MMQRTLLLVLALATCSAGNADDTVCLAGACLGERESDVIARMELSNASSDPSKQSLCFHDRRSDLFVTLWLAFGESERFVTGVLVTRDAHCSATDEIELAAPIEYCSGLSLGMIQEDVWEIVQQSPPREDRDYPWSDAPEGLTRVDSVCGAPPILRHGTLVVLRW